MVEVAKFDMLFYNRDDEGQAVEVELHDNGLGADRVAGDGLYAKYFIEFASSQVKFQVMNEKANYFISSTEYQEVWLQM